MMSQFLVYIQGGLSSLSSRPYLFVDLTLFREEKEEKQKVGEYILYSFPHLYSYTYSSLLPFYRYTYLTAGILNILVPSCHFYYSQIIGV